MRYSQVENEFLGLLQEIRKVPVAFLGSASFDRLFGFILGFLHAKGTPEFALMDRFGEWLRNQAHLERDLHWVRVLRYLSNDDRSAFEAFFAYLDDFLNEQQ